MKAFQINAFLIFFLLITKNSSPKTEVFFSPFDKPTQRLLELINGAQKSIHAAVYMITDKKIAEALANAKNQRGVDVQIITDKISYESIYGKGKFLEQQGIDLYVYFNSNRDTIKTKQRFSINPIMHHKFAIFDRLKVWTGSFNWTASANRYNQENVLLTDEKDVCLRFENCFCSLKELCKSLQSQKTEEEYRADTPLTKSFVQAIKDFFSLPKIA